MSSKSKTDLGTRPFYISGLLYPRMKISRAAEHLNRLREDIRKFKTYDPYSIRERDDSERQLRIYRLELNVAPQSIPIAIGEFAYSLRSALDHLAWLLALQNGSKPSHSSAFPIQGDCSQKSQQRFAAATLGMACDPMDAIRALQPYRRGNDFNTHPLWRLNKLCNFDKHCTVAISCADVAIETSGPPVPLTRYELDGGGVELTIPLASKDACQFKPQPPTLIFGKPIDAPGADFMLSEEDLAEMHRFVSEDVIPSFAGFFSSPTA